MLEKGIPYIKARFTGLFKRNNSKHDGKYVFSDIKWTYLHIYDCEKLEDFDAVSQKTGDYWFSKQIYSTRFWPFRSKTEIFIPKGPKGTDEVFTGDIFNVLIKNIKLNYEKSSFFGKDWHEASGDIYFRVSNELKKKKEEQPEKNKVSGVNIINNPIIRDELKQSVLVPISGNTTTVITGENSQTTSVTYPQTPVASLATPISTSENIGKWGQWFWNIVSLLIFGIILYYLWPTNRMLFYILLGTGALWLLSRVVNLGGFFRAIGSLALFGFIAYFLFNIFYKTSSGIVPVKTRDGNVKIFPPKPNPKPTDDTKRSDPNNVSTEKEVNWFDFQDLHYTARYETGELEFKESISGQEELRASITNVNSSLEFYTRFYNGLNRMDEPKIKAIAKIFSDSASKKNMDALQTAEMVITFIQEIPYYLVHDESCEKAVATNNKFMVDYHNQGKPCLANIAAGVQSPYEFLHNLKGDCDTRSLLGYAILSQLNIASSVWVSEAYGHSILGVAVPAGNGIFKSINGVKHYGVELTAKGFRLGMVAPENNNANNWEITLYNNHS
jgi:hypothetical protein